MTQGNRDRVPSAQRSNKFHWEHDPVTHVDRGTNPRWPVTYVKLQANCDAYGNCSGGTANYYGHTCGQPWGAQTRDLYWCKAVFPDGREEWLYQGTQKSKAYDSFLEHKANMLDEGGRAE